MTHSQSTGNNTMTHSQSTGNNTMHQDLYTAQDTHVEHSETSRIESSWDDSNHIIDELPTHLPNPTQPASEVEVMFDFLNSVIQNWVHCPDAQYTLNIARNELIRNGRSEFYHEVIKALVKMYNPQGGE